MNASTRSRICSNCIAHFTGWLTLDLSLFWRRNDRCAPAYNHF